jgi:hypothetical protein
MNASENDPFVCLKLEDINRANTILVNVINSLKIKEKQRGGGDKFDLVSTLLIAGMISASTFGLAWASGWIMYILLSSTTPGFSNVYEICFSQHNISGIKHVFKGEIGNLIKTYMNSKNVHAILSRHLRQKFGTYDNFIQVCFE